MSENKGSQSLSLSFSIFACVFFFSCTFIFFLLLPFSLSVQYRLVPILISTFQLNHPNLMNINKINLMYLGRGGLTRSRDSNNIIRALSISQSVSLEAGLILLLQMIFFCVAKGRSSASLGLIILSSKAQVIKLHLSPITDT